MTIFDEDHMDEDDIDYESQRVPTPVMSKKDASAIRSKLRANFQRVGKNNNKINESMARKVLQTALSMRIDETDPHVARRKRTNALACAVVNLSVPVLNSLNIRPDVRVQPGYRSGVAAGQTNFKDIIIRVNEEAYDPSNPESVRMFISMLKGLVYHEGGHILWSEPFAEIMQDRVWPKDFSNPYVLKAYSGDDLASMAMNIDSSMIKRAWNLLEDQRMETAMCCVSPILAQYFTNIVIQIVIDVRNLGASWPYIIGRTYLPRELRQSVCDDSYEFLKALHPSLTDEDISAIIDGTVNCVLKYRVAKTRSEMWDCIVDMAQYMVLWGSGRDSGRLDTHENFWGVYTDHKNPYEIPTPPDYDMETPNKDGGSDGSAKSSSSGTPGKGKSASGDTPPNVRQFINPGLVNDAEVENFTSLVNEYTSKSVLPDPTVSEMTNDSIKNVSRVRDQMLSVLSQLTVQVDPSWRFGKEVGVIDPTGYALREPGDTNYWSGLDDSGASGHDLALSLLVDSSGSMGEVMTEVSEIAVGIRAACDELGIPCTLTSFNDHVFSVLEATEPTRFVSVGASGGTNPVTALMALNDQRMGKDQHLVVILTDGEWTGVETLLPWTAPGRFFLLVGWGHHTRGVLENKNADHHVVITELNQLEKLVTTSLVEYFAK